jgi:hypothetical protein
VKIVYPNIGDSVYITHNKDKNDPIFMSFMSKQKYEDSFWESIQDEEVVIVCEVNQIFKAKARHDIVYEPVSSYDLNEIPF